MEVIKMAQKIPTYENPKVIKAKKEAQKVIQEIDDGKITREKSELDAVNSVLEELGQPKVTNLSDKKSVGWRKRSKRIQRKIAIQDFLNVITFGLYQGKGPY